MKDQWMIRGSEFSNCNCDYGCPCQFNAPTTYGTCEAVASAMIEEGYFNDTKLDGLSYVMILKWPGEIAEGNGEQQLIIDERASLEQREAIRKIAHGESTEPGSTHYFVFNSTMSKVHDTLYAPIDMGIDVDGRHGHIKIPGQVETLGTPITDPFSGDDFQAQIRLPNGFEYTVAEIGSASTKTSGELKMNLKDSYGQFNILHMNQDGVIR